MPRQRGAPAPIRTLVLDDFSGGWNPRDAFSQIADNESPDCLNITLDERGGVVKRLGMDRLGSGSGLSGSPKIMFYWQKTGDTIVQDGTAIKKTSDFVTFTTIKTYSTSARAAFCDFQGKLVAVHPADKVSSYDGTTWTDHATSPKGAAIAVWQNKVWVTADPDNFSRVYASNAGDPTVWTLASDYVDVREKDNAPCTALGAGQGMDISGRAGLLVFKAHSVHRINDSRSGSTFGQYTTLHNEAGAAGPLCVVSTQEGTICFIGLDGIYITNGVDQPVLASTKLDPLFKSTQVNFAQAANWCAGLFRDRVVFSLTRGSGQTTNNFMLELHPGLGWIVPHSIGLSAMTSFQTNDQQLYGASATAGKCFQIFKGGADDGSAITGRFSTRWFEPAGAYLMRMRRIRVEGRGDFQIYTKADYTVGDGERADFITPPVAGVWGTSVWGLDEWGSDEFEVYNDFYSLGIAKTVSWVVSETSSTSTTGPKLLQDGGAPEVGAFGLYGIRLDFVRLGYA
jgi:hypothetical protein